MKTLRWSLDEKNRPIKDEATVKESLTVQQEEPVKWIERENGERGEIGDRYLNPAWVEWSRKNEEEQPDSNQTPKPEPEQPEKQSVTVLLRAEIEKRNLRIEKMRKAIDEAIQERCFVSRRVDESTFIGQGSPNQNWRNAIVKVRVTAEIVEDDE